MSVELRQLTKRFGSLVAVHGIDLQVQHGEFLCLLGPSGCGKTTTLRLVAGFLGPDVGEIVVDGRLLTSPRGVVPPERRHMSMIFQNFAVWPHMTVLQNVAYGLRVQRLNALEIGNQARAALRLVRLEGMEGRYPGELSGGQQQRVALARALVVKPQVLLLDEPLSNLDASLREEMRFEIRRLHQELQHTTLYVTHDQSEAMVTADRVAVMNNGRLVQVGTPEEIYERPSTEFVARFIGKSNILEGILVDGDLFEAPEYGLKLKIPVPEPLKPGQRVKVSLRPHMVAMSMNPPSASRTDNVVMGRVARHVYLGDTRDYLVQVGRTGQFGFRVIRPAHEKCPVGAEVHLVIAAASCHLLGLEEQLPTSSENEERST